MTSAQLQQLGCVSSALNGPGGRKKVLLIQPQKANFFFTLRFECHEFNVVKPSFLVSFHVPGSRGWGSFTLGVR